MRAQLRERHRPALGQRRRALQGQHESARQIGLRLHGHHASDRAHHPQPRVVERAAGHLFAAAAGPFCRAEEQRVDAVVDLAHARIADAHPLHEVVAEVARQRHVAVHERRVGAPHPLVAPVRTIDVVSVAAMLAMHAQRHAGPGGGRLHFQCRQVARVHHRRPAPLQQAHHLRVEARTVPRLLAQGNELDITPPNARREGVGHLGQRNDHVARRGTRHVVDQIDDAVLEAAGVEAVDDVADERRLRCGRAALRYLRANGALPALRCLGTSEGAPVRAEVSKPVVRYLRTKGARVHQSRQTRKPADSSAR